MATDTDVYNWFNELGMKVQKESSGNFYFHITVSPPIGEGIKVSIVRPTPNSTYYIVLIIMDLDVEVLKKNPQMLRNIKMDLMRMNVEFVLIPPNEKTPKSIQLAKLVFSEGLTKNEILEKVTLVKNAAYLVLTYLTES